MAEKIQRRADRLKKRVMAQFEVQGRSEKGIVLNLSEMGLFIQTRHMVRPGTELTVVLSQEGGEPIRVQGRVVSAKSVPPQLSSIHGGIGVEFAAPPTAYAEFVKILRG